MTKTRTPRRRVKPRKALGSSRARSKSSIKLAAELGRLRKDVESLKRLVGSPFHARLAALTLGDDPLKTVDVVPQDLVQAEFAVAEGNPRIVRLTLDDTEEVISPPAMSGSAAPRQRGTWTKAFIEVEGTAGSKVVINTVNTTPAKIEITIPLGASRNAGTKPLLIG